MDEAGLKKVAKLAAVYAAVALAVCLYRAATKPVVITGTVQAQEETQGEDAPLAEIYDAKVLTIEGLSADARAAGDDLLIPLPTGIRSEDIRTENHYLSHQLWITMQTGANLYDRDTTICTADGGKVREGVYVRTERDSLTLRFGLTGLYEPETSLADGMLHVKLRTPGEVYARVLLVDPAEGGAALAGDGGAQEAGAAGAADTALLTAQALAALYAEDAEVGVYLTRVGSARDEERSLALLAETDATLCIRLTADEAAGTVRTAYNDTWFLRRYTNAQFARDLAETVTEATGAGLAGIDAIGTEDPLLAASAVPSAIVRLGAGADPDAAAQGIAAAVQRAAEAIGESGGGQATENR